MSEAHEYDSHEGYSAAIAACRFWRRALARGVFLNVIFLVLAIAVAALPTEFFKRRVIAAFHAGDLTAEDWRAHDTNRGFSQYTDCVILQQLINSDEDIWARALGPRLYHNEAYSDCCQHLQGIATGSVDLSALQDFRYSRYWHGYLPISAAGLLALPLHHLRVVLKLLVYTSLLLLGITAFRNRTARPLAVATAVAGATVWGLPQFGQSLSHAPGDAIIFLGLAALVIWHRYLLRPLNFLTYCCGYGATIAYLEFLTGQIPTAAGLLFTFTYLIASYSCGDKSDTVRGWSLALAGLAAFGTGVIITVLIKLGLASVIIGDTAYQSFSTSLQNYATIEVTKHASPGPPRLAPYWLLLKASSMLTGGSRTIAKVMIISTAVAWLAAGVLAWRCRDHQARGDLAAFIVGAFAIVAWVQVLPTYTAQRSVFMVRILIVPIALGWSALLWMARRYYNMSTEPQRSPSTHA